MVISGLAPEIAHFRILGDGVDDSIAPADWYIKGARYVNSLLILNTHSLACKLPAQTPLLLLMPGTSSGMFGSVPSFTHEGFILYCSPETIESIFIAFRLTGDPKYRDYGWAIFQAIEKHCRIPTGGYASVINVDQVPVEYDDKMETFLMVCDALPFPHDRG